MRKIESGLPVVECNSTLSTPVYKNIGQIISNGENSNQDQSIACLRMQFSKIDSEESLELSNTHKAQPLDLKSFSESSSLSESFGNDFSEEEQDTNFFEIKETTETNKGLAPSALEEEIERWLANNSSEHSVLITGVTEAVQAVDHILPVYPEVQKAEPDMQFIQEDDDKPDRETQIIEDQATAIVSEEPEPTNDDPEHEDKQEEIVVTGENEHIASIHFHLALPPIVGIAEPEYTEKEFVNAIKELMTRGQRPPVEMIDPLKVYIKKELCNAIMEQNYDEAEYMKQAESKLSDNHENEKKGNEEKKKKVKSVEERIEAQKQKIIELREKWTQKIEAFEAEKQERLVEIEQKQECELDDFEAHWNNPSTMIAFSKPSSQLLQIRKLQRTAALSNDFARAKELKARADALEKTETKQAERKATASMKAAYKTLTEKHKKEKEFAVMNWRRQLLMIQGERDAELQNAQLCLKQLEIKKSEAAHARPLSCISKPRKDVRTLTTPTTPRTRKQMADFKSMSNQEKLTLMGFNPTEFIRSKRSKQPPISSRRPVLNC